MYLIAGASGNTGRVIAESLIARGRKIRVLMRDSAKGDPWSKRGAEVVVGDLENVNSLSRALEGTEGAYLLIPPDMRTNDLVGRGKHFIDVYREALTKSGVKHVTFLSSAGAHHKTGTGPVKTLHHAEWELGRLPNLRFTFLRAAYFMENLLGYVPSAKEHGFIPIYGGSQSQPFPMVATRDIGELATQMLLEPPSDNRVVELAGPSEYSFGDAARIIGNALGRPVVPKMMPIDDLVPSMTKMGLSQDVAEQFREMTEAMTKGLMAWEGGKAHTRRGATTLDAFIQGAIRR